MPKRNAVLMVVLAVAVIVAMGFLVLRPTPVQAADPVQIKLLLRKLVDSDADVRREAESGLRAMGSAALEPLRLAASSSDRALAGRAAQLLRENLSTASTRREVRSEEIHLEVSGAVVQTEGPRKWLFGALLANQSSLPVLLALAGEQAPWRPAWFEVEDDRGRFTRMEASPEGAIATTGSVVSLAPGKTLTFVSWNESSEALARLKTRSVRFVYDASQSEYRAMAEKVEGGTLLPSAKLVSKTFLLTEIR